MTLSNTSLVSLFTLTGLAVTVRAQDNVPVVPPPPVAAYDIVCAYHQETFALHGLTVFNAVAKATNPNWPNMTRVRMDAVSGLNYLFPTGTCGDLSVYFDPYDVRPPTNKDAPHFQSLPSETLDGVPCRVVQQTDPPLLPRAFGPLVPVLPRVTLRWYIAPDGQTRRIHGEFQLWKADGKTPDPVLLVMDANYRYRDPIGSPSRPLSPPPLRTLAVPLENKDMVRDISCSPAKPLLVTATSGGTLTVWDVDTLKPVYKLQGQKGYGRSMAISPNGAYLADGIQGIDGTARVWDLRTGQKKRDILTGSQMLTSLTLSPDGRLLATGGIRPNTAEPVRVWDTTSGQMVASINDPGSMQAVFSPDGKTLATADPFRVSLWDTQTWKERLQLQPDLEPSGASGTTPLAFSPDGKLLAMGDTHGGGFRLGIELSGAEERPADSVVWVWDTQTGKLVQTLRGTTGPVNVLAWAPNGKWLAVVDSDCGTEGPGRNAAVLVWDTQTWKQAGIAASEHGKPIASVVWTADSAALLTFCNDALVKFWPAPNK